MVFTKREVMDVAKAVKLMEKKNGKFVLDERQKNALRLVANKGYFTGRKIIVSIPLDMLRVDHTYQRQVHNHAKYIERNWDDNRCAPLIVNYRGDGFFYVIDGQHRLLAALALGLVDLECILLVGLSIEEEAEIFGSQGVGLKKPDPYDIFKANVVANESVDSRIKAICTTFNLEVRRGRGVNSLSCLTEARNIVGKKDNEGNTVVDDDGVSIFIEILTIMRKCKWESVQPAAYSKAYILPLYRILTNSKYEGKIEFVKKQIINILSNTTPDDFINLSSVKYAPIRDYAGRNYALLTDLLDGEYTVAELKKIINEIAA